MTRTLTIVVASIVALACSRTMEVPEAVKAELAPGGRLRAAINLGNSILVASTGGSAELVGIAPDIARELAARLDVPVQFVPYPSAAAAADAVGSEQWDVAFIGADPAREGAITFTRPYVELPATYLVPAGSGLADVASVDAPGVRVAARPRTAYDLILRRELTAATLVYPADTESDVDLVTSGRADALAGLRQVLLDLAQAMPGARVLDEDFAAIQQAIGVPAARRAAAAYVDEFVRDIRTSGLVAETIARSGARGVSVPSD